MKTVAASTAIIVFFCLFLSGNNYLYRNYARIIITWRTLKKDRW